MALSKQREATWSSPLADPQPYGYDPQYDPIVMPKKFRIRDNRLAEEDLFSSGLKKKCLTGGPGFEMAKLGRTCIALSTMILGMISVHPLFGRL